MTAKKLIGVRVRLAVGPFSGATGTIIATDRSSWEENSTLLLIFVQYDGAVGGKYPRAGYRQWLSESWVSYLEEGTS